MDLKWDFKFKVMVARFGVMEWRYLKLVENFWCCCEVERVLSHHLGLA
jgi:hypothetical protein